MVGRCAWLCRRHPNDSDSSSSSNASTRLASRASPGSPSSAASSGPRCKSRTSRTRRATGGAAAKPSPFALWRALLPVHGCRLRHGRVSRLRRLLGGGDDGSGDSDGGQGCFLVIVRTGRGCRRRLRAASGPGRVRGLSGARAPGQVGGCKDMAALVCVDGGLVWVAAAG